MSPPYEYYKSGLTAGSEKEMIFHYEKQVNRRKLVD